MSVQQEGKVVAYKNAASYVKEPKGAYGTKSGLQPKHARTRHYTPELTKDLVGCLADKRGL